MKVLFIFDRVAHYHIDLFQCLEEELLKKNVTLYLLAGSTKNKESGRVGLTKTIIKNEYKYRFYELPFLSYIIRFQKDIFRYIKNINPDIIIEHGHVGNLSIWSLGIFKKFYKYELYSWQCGYEYNDTLIKKWFTKRFLKLFDYHLAYHNNALKYLSYHNISKDIISVLGNTINEKKISVYDKQAARKLIVEKHPLLLNKHIILYVGAILREKKIDLLIESYLNLKSNNSSLVIVGDGPLLNELKNKYGGESIIFTGKIINNVSCYFDACDIFVLPGTGGLALNEAMIHRLPIISGYADGSADDLVIHGETGFRLYKYTVDELSEYLRILINDKELRTKMGVKAGFIIYNKYSFNNFINKTVNSLIKK